MKTRSWTAPVAFALLAAAAWAATRTVVVEETPVRRRPKFYAPSVAVVRAGDRVEAGEPQDGWYPVTAGGREGWLHESAFAAAGRVRAGSWGGSAGATADEVTLAGKGFNESVERDYKGRRATANYAAVDRMQARALSDARLVKFMKAGALIPAEDEP